MPICVIPTIGTTSTSSVDPVDAIADICEKYGIWLHVDTAYAGSAAIVPGISASISKAGSVPIRSSSIRTNGCSRRSIFRCFTAET